jgi:hypothetical protein
LDFIEITVRDFHKIIGRKDIKYPQFFAMPNDILEHPDFFNITGDEFKAFAWILGVASKLASPTVRIYPDLCERRTTIKRKVVELTISKLNGKRWDVQVANESRTDSVQKVDVEENRIELNSIELNRREGKGFAKAPPDQPHDFVVIWNLHCYKLSEVKKVSPSRLKKIDALNQTYLATEFNEACERVAASDFCCGKNDRAWIATFDWMLKPDTVAKVLEGKYDNRRPSDKKTAEVLDWVNSKSDEVAT